MKMGESKIGGCCNRRSYGDGTQDKPPLRKLIDDRLLELCIVPCLDTTIF